MRGLVPGGDLAIEALDGDCVVGVGDDRRQPTAVRFLLPALRDVALRRGDGDNLAFRVEKFGGGKPDVEDAAVLGSALRFQRGNDLSSFGLPEEVEGLFAPVFGDGVADVHLERFCLRVPVHRVGPLVPGRDTAVEVLHGDGVIRVQYDAGQAAQRDLLLAAHGDVALGRGEADDLALVVQELRDGEPDVEDAAVLGDALQFEGIDCLAGADLADEVEGAGAFGRGDELPRAHAERFGLRVAVHAFGALVPGLEAAVEVLHGDGVVGVDDHAG